jgi:hypothetical protein
MNLFRHTARPQTEATEPESGRTGPLRIFRRAGRAVARLGRTRKLTLAAVLAGALTATLAGSAQAVPPYNSTSEYTYTWDSTGQFKLGDPDNVKSVAKANSPPLCSPQFQLKVDDPTNQVVKFTGKMTRSRMQETVYGKTYTLPEATGTFYYVYMTGVSSDSGPLGKDEKTTTWDAVRDNSDQGGLRDSKDNNRFYRMCFKATNTAKDASGTIVNSVAEAGFLKAEVLKK